MRMKTNTLAYYAMINNKFYDTGPRECGHFVNLLLYQAFIYLA